MYRLSAAERDAIQAQVATWVPDGPPDDPIRVYPTIQAELFEHDMAGCVVSYFDLKKSI